MISRKMMYSNLMHSLGGEWESVGYCVEQSIF